MNQLDGVQIVSGSLVGLGVSTFNSKACQYKEVRPELSSGRVRHMVAEGFGERVRQLREAKGLSQAAIERATGRQAGKGYLSNIERGGRDKRPSSELVEVLVSLTGVSRTWLLDGQGPMFDPNAPAPQVTRRFTEMEDQFPARAQYIALLGGAADPDIVRALQLERRADGQDPGFDYWEKRYRDLLLRQRKTLADLRSIGSDLEDDDAPELAPRIPRRKG